MSADYGPLTKSQSEAVRQNSSATKRAARQFRANRPWSKWHLDDQAAPIFDKLKRDLVEAKIVRPGLTFHGLRKSLGKRAADAGFSELDIAAALGHSSPASSRPYTIEAARKSGARRVIRALEKKR